MRVVLRGLFLVAASTAALALGLGASGCKKPEPDAAALTSAPASFNTLDVI